jgi:hypothetical protein
MNHSGGIDLELIPVKGGNEGFGDFAAVHGLPATLASRTTGVVCGSVLLETLLHVGTGLKSRQQRCPKEKKKEALMAVVHGALECFIALVVLDWSRFLTHKEMLIAALKVSRKPTALADCRDNWACPTLIERLLLQRYQTGGLGVELTRTNTGFCFDQGGKTSRDNSYMVTRHYIALLTRVVA